MVWTEITSSEILSGWAALCKRYDGRRVGDDRPIHALQEPARPAACDGDADIGEFDLFHRSERLPVAVAAEGISALYDGAALLLPVARRRYVAEDQPPSCHDGARGRRPRSKPYRGSDRQPIG